MQSIERFLQLYSVKNALICDFYLQPPSGSLHCKMHKIKLAIDDRGAIMIFESKDDQMLGKYYIFSPGSSLEEKEGKTQTSICMYGEAKGRLLEGENYIGTQNGLICKGVFVSGLLQGVCLVASQRHLEDSKTVNLRRMNFIHHKIVQTQEQHSSARNEVHNGGINRLDFSKLKKSGTRDNPNEDIAQSMAIGTKQITTVHSFLHSFLSRLCEQPNESKQLVSLRYEKYAKGSFTQLHLPKMEIFIGILHANKSFEEKSYDNFNGFGVVFKDGWPARYGQFNNGQLSGLGRKYETQLMIEDGLFSNGILTQGFKIDVFQNKMCFGYIPSGQINIKQNFTKDEEEGFVVLIQFNNIQEEQILSYRRLCHLKSIDFRNEFSSAPKGLELRCWPQVILGQLNSHTHAFKRILNLGHGQQLNNIDISMIELAQQSSDNRVEREIMAAMNNSFEGRKLTRQPKRSYFKLQKQGDNSSKQSITFSNFKEIRISQFDPSPKQEPFREYIVQYERLTQNKSKVVQMKVVDPSFDSPPETRRALKQIKEEDQNEVNFGELIKTFQLCDNQQRQFRRTSNFGRMSSERQIDRSPVSRLQKIMEDYQESVKQAKTKKEEERAKREQKLKSSRKFRPSQVDLHSIYAEVHGRHKKM